MAASNESRSSSCSDTSSEMNPRWRAYENLEDQTLFDAFSLAIRPYIKSMEEDSGDGTSVVEIEEDEMFSSVLSIYNAVVEGHVDSNAVPSFDPAWMMVLTFALKQSPSHYSAWEQRREVALNPARFSRCVAQNVDFSWLVDTPYSKNKSPLPLRLSDLESEFSAFVGEWLPQLSENQREAQGSTPVQLSVWECVFQELRLTWPFVVRSPKNFQVWNHRLELMTSALGKAKDSAAVVDGSWDFHDPACSNPLVVVLRNELLMCYDAFQADFKNYHAWSYRSSLVSLFPRIASGPADWSLLLLDDVPGTPDEGMEESFLRRGWWSVYKPVEYILPQCNAINELRITSEFISVDCLNNSAWCYRFFIFQRFVAAPAFRALDGAAALSVMKVLCLSELRFAFNWAVCEPCNECVFMYSKGIIDLFRIAVVLSQLRSTRSAACEKVLENAMDLPTLPMLLVRLITTDPTPTENTGSRPNVLPSDISTLMQQTMDSLNFVEAHQLHRVFFDLMESGVSPALRRLAAKGQASVKPDEKNSTDAYSKTRTINLRCNTHQLGAAEFNVLYDTLQDMWIYNLSREQRQELLDTYPSDTLVAEASATTSDPPWQRIGELYSDEQLKCVERFHKMETAALRIVKQIYQIDTVRAKYWAHMTFIVLHREYERL